MAAEIPVIPKTEAILIHTGNIVNWNRLKKKLTQSSTEELTDCIASTIETWLSGADKNQLQFATSIECLNQRFLEKLPDADRHDLKLTVKICLYKWCGSAILEAVDRVMCELGVTNIETVLLSIPDETQHTLEVLKPLWETLEDLVEQEKIFTLGVADLDKLQLEELYNFAKIKPTINQVNLASCCVMPPEMVEFAKENDIQLLTHSDPTDILPAETLQGVMRSKFTEADSQGWYPCWIQRYSVVVKRQGIIKTKGFIVKGCRDQRKRSAITLPK